MAGLTGGAASLSLQPPVDSATDDGNISDRWRRS